MGNVDVSMGNFIGLGCPLLFNVTVPWPVNTFCSQMSHSESEQALQKRLEEVSEELRATKSKNSSLQATLDKTQLESNALSGKRMRKWPPGSSGWEEYWNIECFVCVLIILYLVGSTESQLHIGRLESEVRERSAQVEAFNSQLQDIKVEKAQLVEQLASLNSLLEASQSKKEEDKNQVGHHCSLSNAVRCLNVRI